MNAKPKIHLDSFEEYRTSVLRYIERMLENYYGKDLKKITLKGIKKDEKEINCYENFDQLEPINESRIVVLDDDKISTGPAEKAILAGKFLWEHTAAGEATRLGLGTKYLLNLGQFSLDEVVFHMRQEAISEAKKAGLKGKKLSEETKKINKSITKEKVLEVTGKEPKGLMNISLGNRHMLQMAYDVTQLAKRNKKDPKSVLAKQSTIIILNEQTAEEILEESHVLLICLGGDGLAKTPPFYELSSEIALTSGELS